MQGSEGWVRDVPRGDRVLSRVDVFLDEVFNPVIGPAAVVLAVLVVLTRG